LLLIFFWEFAFQYGKSHFSTQNYGLQDEVLADVFLRNLAAINEFLFYVEAEPFVTPEKTQNRKRVPLKKVKAEE